MTKSVSLPLIPSPSSSMNAFLQIKRLPALQELLASHSISLLDWSTQRIVFT